MTSQQRPTRLTGSSPFILVLGLSVAACSPAPDAGNIAASPTPVPSAASMSAPPPDYTGRWTGVEGMFLDVRPGGQSGAYRLTMQYDLDHRTTVDARLDGNALTFTRDGKPLALRPTNGAATGLKYLAGKTDCLTVAEGEGYCRD